MPDEFGAIPRTLTSFPCSNQYHRVWNIQPPARAHGCSLSLPSQMYMIKMPPFKVAAFYNLVIRKLLMISSKSIFSLSIILPHLFRKHLEGSIISTANQRISVAWDNKYTWTSAPISPSSATYISLPLRAGHI